MRMSSSAQKLEAAFSEIARTRMADVPILNPALRVEAVGFRAWEGRWVGVLVTPWSINLVLTSGQDAPLIPLALDEKAVWNFPSGAYEFIGLNEPTTGTCHICPLISPPSDFATHDEARAVAHEIISALFAEDETDVPKNASRRNFLRMSFAGE